MDDDDEERSRSIPSRTTIGKRASAIEKFPSLGQPLILFGGLITIPFWAYENTPIALIDVMLSDLPRVEYVDKEKITDRDVKRAEEKNKEIQERVKAHGIGANLQNRVNTDNFVKSKMKGQ